MTSHDRAQDDGPLTGWEAGLPMSTPPVPSSGREPATEAGRALSRSLIATTNDAHSDHIEAIEHQAATIERRRVVERIRQAVGVLRTPAGRDIGYIQISERQFRAILDDLASPTPEPNR